MDQRPAGVKVTSAPGGRGTKEASVSHYSTHRTFRAPSSRSVVEPAGRRPVRPTIADQLHCSARRLPMTRVRLPVRVVELAVADRLAGRPAARPGELLLPEQHPEQHEPLLGHVAEELEHGPEVVDQHGRG